MKTTNFFCFFSLALLVTLSITSRASTPQHSIDTIHKTVEAFIREKLHSQLKSEQRSGLSISVRPIDKRLRLQKCDRDLTLSLQGQAIRQQANVKVSCRGSVPWSVYVGSKIRLDLPIVVLSKGLPRRHIIEETDLMTVTKDIYSLRNGYVSDPQVLIGQELKRPLKAGDILYRYHLQAPDIIKKGDRVTVVAKRGGLSVISQGIALGNASEGERVRIENERSSRIIQAKAVAAGRVEVL